MKLSKTVYSLIYPESREVLSNLWQSQPLFLYEKAYERHQDKYHEEFMQAWQKWASPIKVDFNQFTYSYPTAGSTEGLRESLVEYANECFQKGLSPVLHIFEGEYEGYAVQASNYGITVIKHQRNNWPQSLSALEPHHYFYVSQPSAIDGNIWSDYDNFMTALSAKPGVRALVDLCYVGCIPQEFSINLNYPVIERFCFSLSKVFGVYYHRIGGIYSKSPILGLKGNIWFKNLFSLCLGTALLNKFSVYQLPRKYQHLQIAALQQLPQWQASDVIILAHGFNLPAEFSEFNRGPNFRVCLTPTMDQASCKTS